MRAVIYSRFSTDRQNEATIADQVRICTEYAKSERWKVVATYEDKGISGAAIGNRPGMLKMLEASLARKFDVLLCADLSRLSRSTGDLNKMIDRLVSKSVRVIGLQDGYDSARKGHKLQAGLSGVIGEAFRAIISEKTYSALQSRAKDQKPTGGKSYGYEGREIVKGQAAIVRQIFKRFVAGAGLRTIAAELNKKGIASPGSEWTRKTRRKSGWMGSAIRVIVRNEIYIGNLLWNRAQWSKDPDSGRRTMKLRPEKEWIRHHDEKLRIIPQELWDAAQSRNASTSGGPGSKKSRRTASGSYVLSGLLQCSHCSANFVMSGKYSYACSSHIFGKSCENTVRLPRRIAEDKLVRPILTALSSPEETAKMVKEATAYLKAKAKGIAADAADAPVELIELEDRLKKLGAMLKDKNAVMTPDEIQLVIDRAEARRAELKATTRPSEYRQTITVLATIPRAAEELRAEMQRVIGDKPDPELVAKVRTTLRSMFGGQVKLEMGKTAGSLFAVYRLHREVLFDERIRNGSGGTQPILSTLYCSRT